MVFGCATSRTGRLARQLVGTETTFSVEHLVIDSSVARGVLPSKTFSHIALHFAKGHYIVTSVFQLGHVQWSEMAYY